MECELLKYGSFFLALITAAKGIWEYSKAQKYKKIELLEKLISEFEDEKTQIARQLLDDFDFYDKSENIIFYGNLEVVLRDHKIREIEDEIEEKVRTSFDKIFDFYGKLEYLIHLKLLSDKDLYYFEYYLKKIFNNDACLKYAEKYGYKRIKNLEKIMKQI